MPAAAETRAGAEPILGARSQPPARGRGGYMEPGAERQPCRS